MADSRPLNSESLAVVGHRVSSALVGQHLDAVVHRARRVSGKQFRARFVELSARLVLALRGEELKGTVAEAVQLAGSAIEDIHLGSVIVDDIQDGSFVRRGEPSLFRQVGVPLALNAGNWLYFSALKSLMRVPWNSMCECDAVDLAIEAMLLAHEGQAVDLGVDITSVSDEEVAAIVLESATRKTGALVGAAFGLGFLAAATSDGYDRGLYRCFQEFGKTWGTSLQMFDDLGSLRMSLDGAVAKEKLFEDLRNRRPSYVWTVLSKTVSKSQFPREREQIEKFLNDLDKAVAKGRVLDFVDLSNWDSFHTFRQILLSHGVFEHGFAEAIAATATCVSQLQSELGNQLQNQPPNQKLDAVFLSLTEISRELSRCYLQPMQASPESGRHATDAKEI